MPAKDIFHDAVKNALIKAGWTITDDPLFLKLGLAKTYVDLAAEKLLAARRGTRKIAVEVKSFVGASEMKDLEQAMGQYLLYQVFLEKLEPERKLYLAVNEETFHKVFMNELGRLLLAKYPVSMIIFNEVTEVIVQWRI